ncbi:MAG TPA: VOC family protein [Dehalococcoidia bacterium]|nr:VOC family protein [Dehalococcoidia bacterium]
MIDTALKVTGIDHVVLWVSDLKRSKEFYIGLLGMHVAHESDWQSFLRCGQQQVALFQIRDGSDVAPGREMNHMALRLESGEYEEVKAKLEAAGAQVSGRTGDPHCLYFSDPDGHRLQVLTPAEQG